MEAEPPSFQTAAMSQRPSPSKSPATHFVESIHPPSRTLQCVVWKEERVERRTVRVFKPPSFQMAAISDSPSPSKSPATHLTESLQPPSRTAQATCGSKCVPAERYTANVA